MDETTRTSIETFVSHYETLVLATEHEGQPYATRIFFVEGPITATACTIYATLITSSRKLANLQHNPQVGIFMGPEQPSTWLEATAHARVLHNEAEAAQVRAKLAEKSPMAAGFISLVPTASIALEIRWLRITDLTGGTPYTEATFAHIPHTEESHA
jgi:nitroimidazol reductase NimA-like FMN-containing flavoprotein (pyridoxamine 5'-phosphate oxidase superfamily)